MSRRFRGQQGQTAVLFALMIVGLVVFIGLAVDGGSVFHARRVAQNAADSAALTGVHYMVGSNAPTETGLQQVINGIVESNHVGDTDGTPGNAVNENVTIYYTDAGGNRISGCHQVPCGTIPLHADGLEILVDHQIPTYFLGVINRDSLDVGAEAVAVVTGGTDGTTNNDNVLTAFGDCDRDDVPLDSSAYNVDFIGSIHSSSWFINRGDGNHYHGQVTYGEGWDDPAAVPGVYEPDPPGQPEVADPGGDPLAHLDLTVEKFQCSGEIGQNVSRCYDLTVHAPDYGNAITTQLLKQRSPDGGTPFLHEVSRNNWQLRPGLYYGGDYPFDFGERGMSGHVTLVSNSYIKLTENDLQLTSYLTESTRIPGLLLYSTLSPDPPYDACTNHEDLPENQEPINTTGNSASSQPGVYHEDDRPGCVNLDTPSNCYEMGSLRYLGLIYAPNGRVATSGDGATYVGAIIAPSIRINGSQNRREGSRDRPDPVGALFVRDPNLIPPTEQFIILER